MGVKIYSASVTACNRKAAKWNHHPTFTQIVRFCDATVSLRSKQEYKLLRRLRHWLHKNAKQTEHMPQDMHWEFKKRFAYRITEQAMKIVQRDEMYQPIVDVDGGFFLHTFADFRFVMKNSFTEKPKDDLLVVPLTVWVDLYMELEEYALLDLIYDPT